jgi:hypothetical protein
LVTGAISGNPSRKDLSTLRNVPAQAAHFFVIYLIDFVDAEGADLSPTSPASFSGHLLASKPRIDLERHIIKFWFRRTSRYIVIERTTIASSIEKAHLIGHNFGSLSPDTVLVIVRTNLQTAFHGHQSAFAEVISNNLGLFAPADHIDKISFSFSALG